MTDTLCERAESGEWGRRGGNIPAWLGEFESYPTTQSTKKSQNEFKKKQKNYYQ